MKVTLDGQTFCFVDNPIRNKKTRESYFDLVHQVFGLRFHPWYQAGFCKNCFFPYTLFSGDVAIASVGVVANTFKWKDTLLKFAQISTVATHPGYRMRGLSMWLMEAALNKWLGKCDGLYLYANDSVVNFYPRFGFNTASEYRYLMPIRKKAGAYEKLNLSMQSDVDLLIKKHKEGNPFSLFSMSEGVEIMMFHCVTFLRESIYYIRDYDAVVIATQKSGHMLCHDIYCSSHHDINELLAIIACEDTHTVTLGFTPMTSSGYIVTKANEPDSTLFVLQGAADILKENKITIPFLSRA